MACPLEELCQLCFKPPGPKDVLWEVVCSSPICPGGSFHEDCLKGHIMKVHRCKGGSTSYRNPDRVEVRNSAGYVCPCGRGRDSTPCIGVGREAHKKVVLQKQPAKVIVMPSAARPPKPQQPKPQPKPQPNQAGMDKSILQKCAKEAKQVTGAWQPLPKATMMRLLAQDTPITKNSKMVPDPVVRNRVIPGMTAPPLKLNDTRAIAAQLKAEITASKGGKASETAARDVAGAKQHQQLRGAAGPPPTLVNYNKLGLAGGNVFGLLASPDSDDNRAARLCAWGEGDDEAFDAEPDTLQANDSGGDNILTLCISDTDSTSGAMVMAGGLREMPLALQQFAAYLPMPKLELKNTNPVDFASVLVGICPGRTFEYFAIGSLNVAVDSHIAAAVHYDSAALLENAVFYYQQDIQGAPLYIGNGMSASTLEAMGLVGAAGDLQEMPDSPVSQLAVMRPDGVDTGALVDEPCMMASLELVDQQLQQVQVSEEQEDAEDADELFALLMGSGPAPIAAGGY